MSLWSSREIDNQVGTSSEPCKYPHNFLKNFSISSSSQEISSSNELTDATDAGLNNSDDPLHDESTSDKEELKEKISSDLVGPSPHRDSLSPSSTKKVHKPLPYFLYRP